jgi:hypothetical protein
LPIGVRFDRIENVIEQLAAATDAELLAAVAESEAEIARAQYGQLAVLAELNSRNVAGTLGFRGLSQLISAQLRCTPAEARRRTVAVERFGARRGLTGEPLEPLYPATAKAFAVGEIGPQHAVVIADTVEAIPWRIGPSALIRLRPPCWSRHAAMIRTGCGCSASGSSPTSTQTGPARRNSGSSRATGGSA